MGVRVYYYVVAAVLGFGFLIPQHGILSHLELQERLYLKLRI